MLAIGGDILYIPPPMANPLGNKLLEVRKPARYIGGEFGAFCKPWESADLRWALAFPDTYEIGMSNLGHQLLYYILNSQKKILADRVYAPWFDMEDLLTREKQPLYGLESGRQIKEFDILGITIPYELTYTNIVSILKLSGISVFAKDRSGNDPLVVGGGCGAFNPEPIADFFDAIVLGDGEAVVVEISEKVAAVCCHPSPREGSSDRNHILKTLSTIEGVYVPSIGNGNKVRRRITRDINQIPMPDRLITPNLKLVHDRVGIEIQRGCSRGCRFCQAGMIYRPDRKRNVKHILSHAVNSVSYTGYEECALLSLSAGDYEGLTDVISSLDGEFGDKWVNISLPSLRTESLTDDVVRVLSRSLGGGFTLAPEAATDRLRRVINKGNTEDDLLTSIARIFKAGWKNLKLYFMIGLPTEKDEDIDAISVLVNGAIKLGRLHHRRPNITVNISTFVPKSHTPFQWEEQISFERTIEIHKKLRDKIKGPGIKLKLHNPKVSLLEGVFARGDRRLSKVILKAHEKGCRFDAWDEQLRFDTWIDAFFETDIDPAKYLKERNASDELPWNHLFTELDRKFLISEREKALAEEPTPGCVSDACSACGVCDSDVGTQDRGPKTEDQRLKAQDQNLKEHTLSSQALGHKRSCVVGPGSWVSNEGEGDSNSLKNRYRYKITFSKTGNAVFIGHLDLMNIWRRSLRRAGLPLRYSQGFNPRPKISFSPPIKVGVESGSEWCEVELSEECAPEKILSLLQNAFPEGIHPLECNSASDCS